MVFDTTLRQQWGRGVGCSPTFQGEMISDGLMASESIRGGNRPRMNARRPCPTLYGVQPDLVLVSREHLPLSNSHCRWSRQLL